MKDLTLEDYQAIGLKSGLEIHQQLDTEKKLFCRCPVRPYSERFDAEILRHMRPTLSELGEYDGTALMEFKTKKNIIYQINKETVCTYEMDDTPPFELNSEALDIAVEVTLLLGCKLVSEIHIARKQYLDGSIPTGFQRTTILGIDGSIPYGDRKIGIIQLGLEEDACREVSDTGHMRTYRTDRLGIPLIETVTYPEMRSPQEVADVANILRYLVRSTGRVRTGIGAARQDVNVSVDRGQRVEIKGVPRIKDIPLLVHNEAFRQVTLIEIMDELASRGINHLTFKTQTSDVTAVLKGTRYYPVAEALKKGMGVRAVTLKGYRGILSIKTQPETTFAKEVSDRVRVIACLDILPNIAHSDMDAETFSGAEWTKIKKSSGTGENDTVIVVWGGEEDLDTAVKEIIIRAEQALDGVLDETRQALPCGISGFERVLPGPNRMYPDTDLPPIAITEERIKRIRSLLPELPWIRRERYIKDGLSEEKAQRMSISPFRELFDEVSKGSGFEKQALASFLLDALRSLERNNRIENLSAPILKRTIVAAAKKGLCPEALPILVKQTCGRGMIDPEKAVDGFVKIDDKDLPERTGEYLRSLELPGIDRKRLVDFLIGRLKEKFPGQASGRRFFELVDRFVGGDPL